MKYLLGVFLFAMLFFVVPDFCYDKTDGFTIAKIHSNRPSNPTWKEASGIDIPLKEITRQPFTYLASGGQCYAFLSADGNYVLKLFKHHKWRLPTIIETLRLPKPLARKRANKKAKRANKLHRDFNSYALAYTTLPKETALIATILEKDPTLEGQVEIIDKLNISHILDLAKLEFLIQKRATLAYEYINALLDERDMVEAKHAVESIVDLVLTRCEKGIYDEDAKIHRNFGFVDGRAVLIDVGRLKKDERRKNRSVQANDIRKITLALRKHLEEVSPELASHLHTYIQQARP